jgi:hypothetical protein
MKKETARTLTIALGLLILLAILGLGSAAWLFSRTVDVATADEASATDQFDRIRARFAGTAPVLQVRDGEPVLARVPPDRGSRKLETLRLMHWDPDDDSFARIEVPFWLLRLKSGPIEIVSDASSLSDGRLGITVEDLERFGPTLVVDHEGERGDRLLIWTE